MRVDLLLHQPELCQLIGPHFLLPALAQAFQFIQHLIDFFAQNADFIMAVWLVAKLCIPLLNATDESHQRSDGVGQAL